MRTLPLQVTFRNMRPSKAVEAKIQEKFEKLTQFCDRIMNAKVVVDLPHHKQTQGKQFEVTIDLTLPDGHVIANRHANDPSHEDVYVAVRDAFDVAKRQLTEYTDRHAV